MGMQLGKLTAMAVSKIKDKGLYADGGNLYLQVTADGSKSWVLRYMMNGKARYMGLGAVHAVTLAIAREKATDCRRLIASGIDPLVARDTENERARVAASRNMTFKQCAEAYIEAQKAGWKNAKHAQQWENTLTAYAHPVFGNLPVQDIDVALVMKVLEPIWNSKTETASRLRGRIESVLDWAATRGYRHGDNPARWRGKLENLLPARSKVQKVKHHPALPYSNIAAFMEALSEQPGLAARILALTILAATRSSEAIKAKWSEFDLKNKVWVIPAERMKMKNEHRVPLSGPALVILKELQKDKTSEYVFPGRNGKPLSDMAMLMLVRRMNEGKKPRWVDPRHGNKAIVPHGFRSTFRDWCAEQTNYPREVAEAALAHTVADKVEAAYRRSDLFEKRAMLMDEWARYCATPQKKGKVLKLRG